MAPVRTLNVVQTLERCREDSPFGPAMVAYAVGKNVNICPDWVNEQQRYWFSAVENAKNIFVVGVRVHQADEHIWTVLGKCDSSVVYYGVSDADRSEFEAWRNNWGKKNAYFVPAGFAQSVGDMKRRLIGK